MRATIIDCNCLTKAPEIAKMSSIVGLTRSRSNAALPAAALHLLFVFRSESEKRTTKEDKIPLCMRGLGTAYVLFQKWPYIEKERTVNRRWHCWPAVLAFVGLLALAGTPGAQAQAGARCFPETGYCIAGPIRDFWERNGGLMVFGFPITPQQPELIERRPTQVQWFERSRLELHPENLWPYDVLLGRMGADRLGQLRLNWKAFPRDAPAADCRAFAETGHAICGALLAA